MLDYEEELKKFKPSLVVEDLDEAEYHYVVYEYGNRAKDTMANYSHLLHLVLQENNWE